MKKEKLIWWNKFAFIDVCLFESFLYMYNILHCIIPQVQYKLNELDKGISTCLNTSSYFNRVQKSANEAEQFNN